MGLFTIETAAPCTTIIVAVPLTISAVEAGRFKAEDMFILPSFRPSFALLILLISFLNAYFNFVLILIKLVLILVGSDPAYVLSISRNKTCRGIWLAINLKP